MRLLTLRHGLAPLIEVHVVLEQLGVVSVGVFGRHDGRDGGGGARWLETVVNEGAGGTEGEGEGERKKGEGR